MVLEYSLNSDVHLLTAWFNNNYLKVNTQKTQAMSVGNVWYDYTFRLGDSKTIITDSMKILGVALDRRLTNKDQITEHSPLQGLHSVPSGVLWTVVNWYWESSSQKTGGY